MLSVPRIPILYRLAAFAGASAFVAAAGLLAATGSVFALAAAAGILLSAAALAAGWARSHRNAGTGADEIANLRGRLDMDPLTGLMNRAAFHGLLDQPWLAEHDMLILLFFDLDRFKEVNDTLGHRAGDELLRQMAGRATATIANPIGLARLGGDEFACVIGWDAHCTPEDYGRAIVEAVSAPYAIDGQEVKVGVSVGIAVGDPTRMSGYELLRRADLAMYAAKASPAASVRVFDDAMDRHEMRESTVRFELGKAMIENMFALHYQPLVDARSGAFSSAEALLRAQSPGLRDISPAALIATAEASGQIIALTDWTIETALAAARRLQCAPIAVNISPVYFRRPDFFNRLMDQLLIGGARPDMLSIEITEGILIENLEAARHSISRIREIGIKVFLDDFGTGYSSLGYLQHFELDGLKLDKSFLRNAEDRRKANQIIRSVIDFGHSLDMRVVVEGVESDWQARLLQLLGCDLLQGYEIGMPMPLDDLLVFAASRSDGWPAVSGIADLPLPPVALVGNQ